MSNLKTNVPIVFFHLGNPNYLQQVIDKSREFNSRVVLLGDNTNTNLDVEHYDCTNFQSKDIEEFVKSYKHMSTNNLNFEILCFVRWFFIRDFMKNTKTSVCFHADSDLLVYSDLSSVWSEFSDYRYCLMKPEDLPEENFRWSASGHNSFWTYDGICEFCNFLLDQYKSPEKLEELMDKWRYHIDNDKPGGVCDMTLIWRFIKHKGEENVGILSEVTNGSTFDDNISDPNNRKVDEYELDLDLGIKKITFEKGRPYGYNNHYKEKVKFHTLHMQGPKKALIRDFLNETV